jgi:hypothetical protein
MEWFIIQSFYHGLIHTAHEHIDDAARGSFFALSIEDVHKLIEKMASNQSWDDERTSSHTHNVHQLEEVDMLTTKIDLLMKKFENPSLDHLKMVDVHVTCEECGETGHMGVNCPTVRMLTLLVTPIMVFMQIRASTLGGTSPVSRSTTSSRVVMGKIATEMSPNSGISSKIS